MNGEYKVITPGDFKMVIIDVFKNAESKRLNTLVIALQGDLGAGKTTFVQQLAEYLEVSEIVTSPTFTIMKQYDLSHPQFDKLVHIDAYRFESEAEAVPLGLAELFKQHRTIVCVEWPELIPNIISNNAVKIKIEIKLNEERLVTVSSDSSS